MDPAQTAPSPTVEDLPTQQGYDRWAAIYDEEDNPLIALEERHLPPLLLRAAGGDVLDVGCGTGRHALRLAAAGARVTAIDFSEGMLVRAREKPGADAVRFLQHDLAGPLPFPDGAFDLVVSGLVLEHITDLPGLFRELRRVCRPGGAAILSAMHPAMLLRGTQASFTDPATGNKVRPRSHRSQISDFVMAAVRARFSLAHLSEHAVDEALARASPRAEKYLGWPMLLLLGLSAPL